MYIEELTGMSHLKLSLQLEVEELGGITTQSHAHLQIERERAYNRFLTTSFSLEVQQK